MIIKSMSRKGDPKKHFSQLISYINRKAQKDSFIFHNMTATETSSPEHITESFLKNAQTINIRGDLNCCYHEIISLTRKNNLEREKEALEEITRKYVEQRAEKQLSYGRIHVEKDHIHAHLCISSNNEGSSKRKRLSKHQFLSIQKSVEKTFLKNYPDLNQAPVYTKSGYAKSKTKRIQKADSEYHINKRGNLSKKQHLSHTLKSIFEHAKTAEELTQILKDFHITLTKRGGNITASHNKIKCRLSTLNLTESYQNCLSRISAQHNQKKPRPESKPQREMNETQRRMEELRAIREAFEQAQEYESDYESEQI